MELTKEQKLFYKGSDFFLEYFYPYIKSNTIALNQFNVNILAEYFTSQGFKISKTEDNNGFYINFDKKEIIVSNDRFKNIILIAKAIYLQREIQSYGKIKLDTFKDDSFEYLAGLLMPKYILGEVVVQVVFTFLRNKEIIEENFNYFVHLIINQMPYLPFEFVVQVFNLSASYEGILKKLNTILIHRDNIKTIKSVLNSDEDDDLLWVLGALELGIVSSLMLT
jgi:hypothetical protein